MKKALITFIILSIFFPLTSFGQKDFFDEDLPLAIQISGNIRTVLDDRGEVSTLHPMLLSYTDKDSNKISIPIELKTRGHFRKARENCSYPPLLISFSAKEKLQDTYFSGQVTLKLVTPCRDEEYVIREWLVYKLYNLITPRSFRARLVRVQLIDPQKKNQSQAIYGILLESEKQVADRNHEVLFNNKSIRPEQTDRANFLNMSVFEYMIGNTDWSVEYLQNVKMITPEVNGLPYTIPYDFDHAGIVGASYAQPAEELRLSSIYVRRYRGFCVRDMQRFSESIALFNQLKDQFYAIYAHCNLLDPKYIKKTLRYLDEFYLTINDPKATKKEFSYPCDPNGTGNVVIKGLSNE